MDLLKTGIGLTKTIKNVSRFREILNVFWRNGFDEFIIKSNLHSKIPGFVLPKKRIQEALNQYDDEKDFGQSVGYRLRKSFEELGPSFIKVGQLLSTREDILDPALIKELKFLPVVSLEALYTSLLNFTKSLNFASRIVASNDALRLHDAKTSQSPICASFNAASRA